MRDEERIGPRIKVRKEQGIIYMRQVTEVTFQLFNVYTSTATNMAYTERRIRATHAVMV